CNGISLIAGGSNDRRDFLPVGARPGLHSGVLLGDDVIERGATGLDFSLSGHSVLAFQLAVTRSGASGLMGNDFVFKPAHRAATFSEPKWRWEPALLDQLIELCGLVTAGR